MTKQSNKPTKEQIKKTNKLLTPELQHKILKSFIEGSNKKIAKSFEKSLNENGLECCPSDFIEHALFCLCSFLVKSYMPDHLKKDFETFGKEIDELYDLKNDSTKH